MTADKRREGCPGRGQDKVKRTPSVAEGPEGARPFPCAESNPAEVKRADQALGEANEHLVWLARMPEENPNPVLRVSGEGTVLYCNPASAHLPGWACRAGQPLPGPLPALVAEAMARGGQAQQDVEMGGKVYAVWVAPIVAEGYANVYGRDITGRKQAEESLRQFNAKLEQRVAEQTAEIRRKSAYNRSLIEASLDPLVTIGPDGSITDVNAATEAATGRTRQELIGTDFSAYFTEPDQARTGYQRVFKEGSVRDYPLEIRHRDGRTMPVLYNAALYRDEAGQVIGIFAAARDITERKGAEARARAEHQRLYDVLETLPVYVVLLTSDYRVPFANRYFEERFGKSNGQRCYEYLFNRPEPCENCETFKVMKTRAPHHWYWTGPDGRDYDIYDFPFTDSDGSPLIMEMGIDVTERNRAERALRDRSEQLRMLASELTLAEQRERVRLARVLHDGLQQLLVGARFRLAALERTGDAAVRRVAADLGELLADSIEMSRSLTAELSPPILHEAGLVPALEWLVRWMRDTHGLTVDLDVPSPVGAIAEDISVLLFQATRELLFNVVKHAGVKSAKVRVTREDTCLRIAVADEGCGFDPSRLRGEGGSGGGFGLFGIGERLGFMGGRMDVDSAPGRGSRFALTAPLVAPAERPLPDEHPARVSVVITPPFESPAEGRIHVLLVDDHIVMRQGLAMLLRGAPDMAVVGEASDGESAVRLVRQVRPDVVLMDISMPGMNGVEATRAIHGECPDVRVIGLSMFEEGQRAEAMRQAGAVDYVTKSGPAEALLAAIRACAKPRSATAGSRSGGTT